MGRYLSWFALTYMELTRPVIFTKRYCISSSRSLFGEEFCTVFLLTTFNVCLLSPNKVILMHWFSDRSNWGKVERAIMNQYNSALIEEAGRRWTAWVSFMSSSSFLNKLIDAAMFWQYRYPSKAASIPLVSSWVIKEVEKVLLIWLWELETDTLHVLGD